jgi:hypothetical protein
MARVLAGCLRRVFLLAFVAAAGAAVWHFRGALADGWRELRGSREGAPLRPTAELAETAEEKLASLAGRQAAPGRIALTEAELQSLVEYRLAAVLPPYIAAPRVRLEDGRMRLEARVAMRRLPELPELGELGAFLPDTADVAATGHLIPLGPGRVAIALDGISVARVPLPARLIPPVLRRLGRKDEDGLPANAIAAPLPAGAGAAYVLGDSMVLVADGGGRNSK